MTWGRFHYNRQFLYLEAHLLEHPFLPLNLCDPSLSVINNGEDVLLEMRRA